MCECVCQLQLESFDRLYQIRCHPLYIALCMVVAFCWLLVVDWLLLLFLIQLNYHCISNSLPFQHFSMLINFILYVYVCMFVCIHVRVHVQQICEASMRRKKHEVSADLHTRHTCYSQALVFVPDCMHLNNNKKISSIKYTLRVCICVLLQPQIVCYVRTTTSPQPLTTYNTVAAIV